MFQDTYTQTEKYHSLDRTDRRSSVHTRRRRTPQRKVIVNSNDNTNSETDVPVGQGLGYPPQVFTDPEFAAYVSHMEEEEVSNNAEGNRQKFIEIVVKHEINVVKLGVGAILLIGEKSW